MADILGERRGPGYGQYQFRIGRTEIFGALDLQFGKGPMKSHDARMDATDYVRRVSGNTWTHWYAGQVVENWIESRRMEAIHENET